MLASIAERTGFAIVLGVSCFFAWKLLGQAVLYRARRVEGKGEGALLGFTRGKPGILIFGSPRCAPCVYAQKPAANRLSSELGPAIQLIEVDVTEKPEIAERFGVVSLPTVFVFDATGRPRKVNHGLVTTDELRRQISPYLA